MESNPFATDIVDSYGSDVPESDRLILHGDVLDALEAVLERMRDREAELRRGGSTGVSAPGHLLLLIAPAAGYGKTYFLARAARAFSNEFEMVPLRFRKGSPIGPGSVLKDLVEHCCVTESPSGELRLIDELARRVFADLTAHLIRSGEVPAPDPQEALRALTETPLEVFDFSNPEGKVVQWFCGVFEALLPSIAAEAARRYGLTREAASFWLQAFYERSLEVARREEDGSGRERFFSGMEGESEDAAEERLSALGKLLSRWRPVIFIADHLDSFFGDRECGARLGRVLVDLPMIVQGSVTIASVNRDLWEATIQGTLPGAVEDRLTSEALVLGGMSPGESKQLLEQRLAEAGIDDDISARFLLWMEPGDGEGFGEGGELSPRRFLRIARERWDAFAASGYGMPVESKTEGIEDGTAESPGEQAEGPASSESETQSFDFGSLYQDVPGFKETEFKPLEPLVFDRHLTLRPKRFKVPSRDEIETSPMEEEATEPHREAADIQPEQPALRTPGDESREGSDAKEQGAQVSGEQDQETDHFFSFEVTAREEQQPAGQGEVFEKEPALGEWTPAVGEFKFFGEEFRGEEAPELRLDKQPEPEPADEVEDREPAGEGRFAKGIDTGETVPPLAETVENLKAEAQKVFFEFHEIFKEALSPEHKGAGSTEEEAAPGPGSRDELGKGTFAGGGGGAGRMEELPKGFEAEGASKTAPAEGGGSGGLAGEYHRLRREILTGLAPNQLDLVRCYAVLNGVGELLPVVVQNEFDLPEHPGFRVLEWSNESQLLFFGLLSAKNPKYWNALIRYASRFLESDTPGNSKSRGRIVKVVVLAPEGEAAIKASHWQNELSDLGGRFPSIDVIEIDRETVAAIYATARMLEEARNLGRAGKAEAVLRFAIRELDFFWRRLTRGVDPAS